MFYLPSADVTHPVGKTCHDVCVSIKAAYLILISYCRSLTTRKESVYARSYDQQPQTNPVHGSHITKTKQPILMAPLKVTMQSATCYTRC